MKIRINSRFNAFGPAFKGIEAGKEFEVLREDEKGWWIMGNGEEVLILSYEAREV